MPDHATPSPATPPPPPARLRWPRRRTWLILILLAIAPVGALVQLSGTINWRWLAGFFGTLNLLTFLLYRLDKRRAEKDGPRIAEATLHLLELAGGWPAALLAQRALRHKSAKRSYQAVFWLIVALHELVTLDYVLGWPLTRRVLLALG